jgi:hypothetical protein
MATKGKAATRQSQTATALPLAGATEPAAPERKKFAAADFYSALQRSLDAVQRQLSGANNAFADFVVKEFKVDAAVQITINEVGVLQLAPADDVMAPQSVSRISLTLAAVAKAPDQSPPRNMAKADVTALADLDWLPPQLVAQLAAFDIRTVSEFLGLVADARFATQIVSALKVERVDAGRWADRMRLLELPGMTIAYVQVLGKLGINAISDIAKLGEKDIAELQRKAPKDLTTEMLTKWRDAALAAQTLNP